MNMFSTLVTSQPSRPGVIPWKAFIFSVVIFGLTIIIYAGVMLSYKASLSSAIEEQKNRIDELERSVLKEETERGFIQFYSQLTNIRNLLESHVAITPIFTMLETNTKTDIGFSNMAISARDRSINISGFARSYEALAAQIAIYKDMPGVQEASLISAERADNMVNFDIKIVLEPTSLRRLPIN